MNNVINYHDCGNGFGIVLQVWCGDGSPVYATHGAQFESGRPVIGSLFSGHYFTDERDAQADFAKRCEWGY